MSAPPAGRTWLVAAGALSTGIALLHAGIPVAGPRAYAYFGAGDLVPLAEAGSPVPALVTLALALVFGVWGWYAFAGAGLARRPPLLRAGLWTIGAVYAARGLAVVPELLALARGSGVPPPRYAVFSLVALATGVAYLVGAWRGRGPTRGAVPPPPRARPA